MTLTPTSTAMFHGLSRSDLNTLNAEIVELQGRIATGKQDPRPSTDLLGAMRLSAAEERDTALSGFEENAARAASRLDQADIVVEEATNVMRRARDLALQSLSDTASPELRERITAELKILRDGLMSIGNTRDDQGRMLFGGFQTQTEPFADVGGVMTFQGDTGVPRLAISESRSIETGVSGQQVFGTGTPNGAFEALDDLIALLEGGTVSGLTRDGVLDGLAAATDSFIAQRTHIGVLSASAQQQSEFLASQRTDLAATISGLKDLDLADTILRLQEAMLARDAAQQTYAQVAQRSLFDYLR
ncbi:MAG: flagellar hook-associated protein FlgL [Rhodobacteraceae bacterium]|nr:flagellar hook-associated protein FlgL [Paracoccaceae bacterium]